MDEQNATRETSDKIQSMDAGEIFNKKHLEGEHTKIDELFNKHLYLQALLYIKDGPKGDFAVLQIDDAETGHQHTFSTGSHIILEKLEKLTDGLKSDDFGVFKFNTPYRIKLLSQVSAKGKEYHDITGWS